MCDVHGLMLPQKAKLKIKCAFLFDFPVIIKERKLRICRKTCQIKGGKRKYWKKVTDLDMSNKIFFNKVAHLWLKENSTCRKSICSGQIKRKSWVLTLGGAKIGSRGVTQVLTCTQGDFNIHPSLRTTVYTSILIELLLCIEITLKLSWKSGIVYHSSFATLTGRSSSVCPAHIIWMKLRRFKIVGPAGLGDWLDLDAVEDCRVILVFIHSFSELYWATTLCQVVCLHYKL